MHADPRPEATAPTMPQLALRAKEAARALGIGTTLLWSWTNQGLIPHVKMGKCVLYPTAALAEWLADRAAKGGRR